MTHRPRVRLPRSRPGRVVGDASVWAQNKFLARSWHLVYGITSVRESTEALAPSGSLQVYGPQGSITVHSLPDTV